MVEMMMMLLKMMRVMMMLLFKMTLLMMMMTMHNHHLFFLQAMPPSLPPVRWCCCTMVDSGWISRRSKLPCRSVSSTQYCNTLVQPSLPPITHLSIHLSQLPSLHCSISNYPNPPKTNFLPLSPPSSSSHLPSIRITYHLSSITYHPSSPIIHHHLSSIITYHPYSISPQWKSSELLMICR